MFTQQFALDKNRQSTRETERNEDVGEGKLPASCATLIPEKQKLLIKVQTLQCTIVYCEQGLITNMCVGTSWVNKNI